MARSTVGKLATKTAAAAKRMTVGAAKKATPESAPAKKKPAKAAAKKTTAPAKKSAPTAKKTAKEAAPAKKSPAKKSTAKAAPAKKAPVKDTAAKKNPARKTPAKKTSANASPTKRTVKKPTTARKDDHASSLAVKEDESPWTPAELEEVRAELTSDAERLRSELDVAERELDDLMRDAGDGAGNDQADVGSTTFERDHEMSLANNARTMLTQTEHALERINDGTYGRCESCGQPIGKNRLMAFPRATLCLTCKQKEERR